MTFSVLPSGVADDKGSGDESAGLCQCGPRPRKGDVDVFRRRIADLEEEAERAWALAEKYAAALRKIDYAGVASGDLRAIARAAYKGDRLR